MPRYPSARLLRPIVLGGALWLSACGGSDDAASPGTPSAQRAQALAVTAAATAAPAQARWSAPMPLSLVPAAAAQLPDGKLLLWAAQDRFGFNLADGKTYSALFDPATGSAVERLSDTGHNMFCPGTSNLADGRLLVSGGSSSGATSLYDPVTGTWSPGAAMNITRAYQANTLLQDGSVLTLGGSWNGGTGGKHAEVWTATGGWRRLSGVPVDPAVGPDPGGVYRGDNHMWLFATAFGRVLHAGPAATMNWIDPRGNGAITPAGSRGDDRYAMNGSVAMYEDGKILKTGGAPGYENINATSAAHLIDVTGGTASVRRLAPMAYQRAFHNSVVLPNGQVLVIGGQTLPVPFSDNNSVLVPELWDPVTESFTPMPAMQVPRNYHSTALLLPDGRVASIGGGLCGAGCAANHADLQILTPHYLLNPDGTPAMRPAITAAAASAAYGSTLAVTTDSPVTAFALLRLSSVTHGVNNDQRRLSVAFTATGGNQYALQIPSNPGSALPGHYMLFAMNAAGVPSVARMLRIAGEATPSLQPPGDPTGEAGRAVTLNLVATGAGPIAYAASGLPPGLAIDPASGAITGTPSTPGSYRVTVSASNAAGRVSTDLLWRVMAAGSGQTSTRWVKLEALSEVAGNPWTSVAEFNLLDASGAAMPRSAWTVSADSQEVTGEFAPASRAIDGLPGTYWHTQWRNASPPPPHSLVIDRGSESPAVGGFRMLPRQDSRNGRIAAWRLHVSADGLNWRQVAQGSFANDATEKTVFPIATGGSTNRPPVLGAMANPTHSVGDAVSLALVASDPDGDALSWQASNLPPGLSLDAARGIVSGSPTAAGVYGVGLTAADGRGGTATGTLAWTVLARSFSIQPVAAPPVVSGGSAQYTAVVDGGVGAGYVWDFGDGTPAGSGASVSHAYAAPGLYAVSLTVTDAAGQVRRQSFTQAVYAPATGSARPSMSSSVVTQGSGSAARIWLVNQDGDSVSLFNAATLNKIGEVAVGSMPRTAALAPDGRLWVANKGSATISIVNPATMTVAQTLALPRASMPFGIAFAPDGSAAYVTLEASGSLLRLNPATGAVLATLAVGPNPRHLSITAGSDRVLVSRFVSPPLPGESTAAVQTQLGGARRGGELVVVSAASLTIERTVVLQVSDKPDSSAQGRGLPNYLGAAALSPDGRSAWIPSKQDNVQRGALRDGRNLDFQNTVRAISSRIDLPSWTEDHAARIDHDNSGLGSAAAFHPTGAYLFVALQTSREVAVVDPVARREILRFDAGRAPDGLAVSADGLRLFVNNLMDRSLQVFDLAPLVNFGQPAVSPLAVLPAQATETLSAQVLQGKRLFYDARDPRLARDAYLSCASCHNDGGHDGRVWDFTGQGEGLRNTTALRGRAGMGQGLLHWSGNFDEVQDFEGQIRTLAQGSGLMSDAAFNTGTRAQPLGLAKAGQSADLDALAAYLRSLASFANSPLRAAGGTLTAAATAGRAVFAASCASCHGGPSFTDSGTAPLRNIGTLKPSSGRRLGGALTGIDTPTLRDAWATAPYLHDGSAATLADAIAAHTALALTDTQRSNVADYVAQIGGEEPGLVVSRWVRLQALSEVNGNPWTSVAEFDLLDASGAALPRTGWIATADSQETARENAPATAAIDGLTGSWWHTQWSGTVSPLPHALTMDLGAARGFAGFRMLPRTDGSANGRIANWRLLISSDGLVWTTVTSGTFANTAAAKTVLFRP